MIPHENEGEYDSITYQGEQTVLNRANTEPNNMYITSKQQAVIVNENGKWYIEDKSELQTTYLYVSGKREIHSGDIILLGNRRFIFEE